MRVGQARKRDANEPEICAALEQIGCVVFKLSGASLPDLLISRRGAWFVMEVKMPQGRLTLAQERRQRVAPCPIVTSPKEALALFGVVVEGL